jgi:hypothetical protein
LLGALGDKGRALPQGDTMAAQLLVFHLDLKELHMPIES